MRLYALHDKKSSALSAFHCAKSDAVASRGFQDAVNEPNSQFGKYPEDFELVVIAEVSEEADAVASVVPLVMSVVLTAEQVVAMRRRPDADGQLSLLKEA